MSSHFNRLLVLSIVAALIVLPAPAQAGPAEKILDRYKKAIGGKAVSKLKSTILTGTIMAGETPAGRFSSWATGPDRLRIDIDAESVRTSECYNGKSGWKKDSKGLRSILGADAKRMRIAAVFTNSKGVDLKKSRILPKATGLSTIDGVQTDGLELILDDVKLNLFFDKASGLLIKQQQESSEGLHETLFGDYRKVDGVMEPFLIRMKRGDHELRVIIDSVRHNVTPDALVFRHPAPGESEAIPNLESLIKSIVANQEKVEELREHYTYRAQETEREFDNKGNLRIKETKEYEVTPVAGSSVNRLISVNGKALTEREQEKEDRRVQNEVEDAIKDQEKRKRKREEAKKKGEPEDPEGGDVTILTFLRISEITSVRREIFRGEEVIAFDFEPKKGFKPKGMGESIASKFAGTIWVDEKALQVARLEARLTDSFKVGGGLLASISPNSTFVFEQQKVDQQIWLPSYFEVVFAGRIMLLKKIKGNMATRLSNYKKYEIKDEYTLTRPKGEETDKK